MSRRINIGSLASVLVSQEVYSIINDLALSEGYDDPDDLISATYYVPSWAKPGAYAAAACLSVLQAFAHTHYVSLLLRQFRREGFSPSQLKQLPKLMDKQYYP